MLVYFVPLTDLGTQEDQDHVDEKVRQKALSDLVQSWMDRLQLISVVVRIKAAHYLIRVMLTKCRQTTFFAAIEAQLLGTTTPDPDNKDSDSRIDQAANAALAGAMVVHVFAAIVSFFAAFFLIRYKLSMAKREERKVELGHIHPHEDLQNRGVTIETSSNSSVWSSNPHLEQVGPFRRGQPPTHLLDHCHSLCMWLSAVGFVLAMVGVMCFVWSRLSKSASIFASVCVGVCLVSGVGAIFWPASSIHRKPKVA